MGGWVGKWVGGWVGGRVAVCRWLVVACVGVMCVAVGCAFMVLCVGVCA